MNKSLIYDLIKHKRVGLLIKLIKNNEFNWSVSDFQYIFDECVKHKLYDIFYFLIEIFNKRSCIDFIDNEKYHTSYIVQNINKVFIWACGKGHKKIVSYLLSHEIQERYPNIDPSANDNYGFRWACDNGQKEIVEYLLSSGIQERYPKIDPSADDNYGFISACYNEHKKIVEYLLSPSIQERYSNIDPSALDNEGFRLACYNGYKEIVEYLLSKDIQEIFPQLHVSNLSSERIENIEKCIGYSIQ